MENLMTNEQLYHSFLKEPMQGAVLNITKWRFQVWFKNGTKVWINKAQRYSHKALKLGDLKTFQVIYIEDKKRYVLNIVGENNSLIPIEKRVKQKNVKKTKKTNIRDIDEGLHRAKIHYIDERRAALSIDEIEYTIYTPLLFKQKKPPLGVEITIHIEHMRRISKDGKEFIAGRIIEWNQ